MEITVGIRDNARELQIDVDLDSAEVEKLVAKATEKGTSLILTDSKNGRRTIVPSAAIGFVLIGNQDQRRVGFGIS